MRRQDSWSHDECFFRLNQTTNTVGWRKRFLAVNNWMLRCRSSTQAYGVLLWGTIADTAKTWSSTTAGQSDRQMPMPCGTIGRYYDVSSLYLSSRTAFSESY